MTKKTIFRRSKKAVLSPILNKKQCIERKHMDFAKEHIGNGDYICGNKQCKTLLPKNDIQKQIWEYRIIPKWNIEEL